MKFATSLPFLLGAVSLALACGSSQEEQSEPGQESAIVGGVDAKSAKLDAVGALLYRRLPGEPLELLCSAALIGPQTVLTAKHCAVELGTETAQADSGVPPRLTETRFIEAFAEVYFAIGSDTASPKRLVRLDAAALCNDFGGGFLGIGCDVATYHLKEAVAEIKPLKVASGHLLDSRLGGRMMAIGYGVQNHPATAMGTRKAGSLTLRATRGQPLRVLYPTFEDMQRALTEEEGAAWVANQAVSLEATYNQNLKPDYEAFLGGANGDVQVCNGDSGGPLLVNVRGELVIEGVASAVLTGPRVGCNVGAVYATLGPAAQTLVRDSLNDPCDGIPSAGRCEQEVAVRCTAKDEGPRRVVRTDCGELLQRCIGPNTAAAAGAGDAGDAGDAGHPPTTVSCGD